MPENTWFHSAGHFCAQSPKTRGFVLLGIFAGVISERVAPLCYLFSLATLLFIAALFAYVVVCSVLARLAL